MIRAAIPVKTVQTQTGFGTGAEDRDVPDKNEHLETEQKDRRIQLAEIREMVEGRPMEEPGQPLPNEVYITYLNTMENRNIKSEGTISNQRTEYEDFVRKNLCLPSID